MKQLPDSVPSYKKTPVFTEDNIPEGMLNTHKTKAGIWGVLHVTEGSLTYCIDEPILEKHALSQGDTGIIEPEVAHHLEFSHSFQCYVEFYK